MWHNKFKAYFLYTTDGATSLLHHSWKFEANNNSFNKKHSIQINKEFGFFPWNLYPKTVATSVLTFFKDLYKTKFHENYDWVTIRITVLILIKVREYVGRLNYIEELT